RLCSRYSPPRQVVPTTRPQSATASRSVAKRRADFSTSRACAAIERARKLSVRPPPTTARSRAPKFFIARATEPILPEPFGRTRTTRMSRRAALGARREWGIFSLTPLDFHLLCEVAKPVFQDNRAALGVEIVAVVEGDVHDRFGVFRVLGAENMAELVNQRDYVQGRLRVAAAIAKRLGDGAHEIGAQ